MRAINYLYTSFILHCSQSKITFRAVAAPDFCGGIKGAKMRFCGGKNLKIGWKWLILTIFFFWLGENGGRASDCPPSIEGTGILDYFFTLDHLEFQLVHLEDAGIPGFFTRPHLEFQTFFYSWAPRGCWNSRLFCRNRFGIPGFFFCCCCCCCC